MHFYNPWFRTGGALEAPPFPSRSHGSGVSGDAGAKAENTSTITTTRRATLPGIARGTRRSDLARRLAGVAVSSALGLAGLSAVAPAPAAAASDITVAAVNSCGGADVKTTVWGQWQSHTGCDTVKSIAVSPDAQSYAVINADGSASRKQGLWGTWTSLLGPGDARAIALGPNGIVAALNGCGAMYVIPGNGQGWQQHLGCGYSKVAVSSDGRYFAVIDGGGGLFVKDGLWGQWQRHSSDARDVTLGPGGRVGVVNACDAVYLKTSLWGPWEQHMGCGSARNVRIAPDGDTIGVMVLDGSLAIKQGWWAQWQRHTPASYRDLALASAAGTPRTLQRPTPGLISSLYGMRYHPISGDYRMHTGIDIAAAGGTPVVAAESGTVVYSAINGGYGEYVCVRHSGDMDTCYAHLSRRDVARGAVVSRGQRIGLVGSTGNSTGDHLHFEVKVRGSFVDPQQYL